MRTPFRTRQAGEGKVGCFITLIILVVGIAVGIKAIPIYYSNNEFVKACRDDIAPNASRASRTVSSEDMADQITKAIKDKARELEIPEALAPGAIAVTVQQAGSDTPGNVHIVLKYGRPVDFYGVTSYTFDTDETMDVTLLTNIK